MIYEASFELEMFEAFRNGEENFGAAKRALSCKQSFGSLMKDAEMKKSFEEKLVIFEQFLDIFWEKYFWSKLKELKSFWESQEFISRK